MALNEADLPSNLTGLKNVDALLRCPICFEFLNIAMMTKCSHNFCSLCMRKFLSHKLQCPVCNSPTTEQDLRNNRILDDLVVNFQGARQQLSKMNFDSPPISPKISASAVKCQTPRQSGRTKGGSIRHFFQNGSSTSPTTEAQREQPAPWRKKRPGPTHTHTHDPVKKTIPKKSFPHLHSLKSESVTEEIPAQVMVSVKLEKMDISVLESFKVADYPSTSQDNPVVKVECPVCSVAISQQFINRHLDNCLCGGEKRESLRSSLGGPGGGPGKRKPMGKLVYTLLSLQELKRKMKACNLSAQGTREQMTKRHQEFVHIYNAQCDSLNPMSAEDIAKEVEASEKTRNQLQGKNKREMVFSKDQSAEDIDKVHSNYRKQHSSEFSRLIDQVRGRLEPTRRTQIKQEVRNGEGEAAQGEHSAALGEGAGQQNPNDSPSCVLLTSAEVTSEEQAPVLRDISRSPSPSISDVSISSSISDIFGPEPDRSFENTEKALSEKRFSCSSEGDLTPPLTRSKRARKT